MLSRRQKVSPQSSLLHRDARGSARQSGSRVGTRTPTFHEESGVDEIEHIAAEGVTEVFGAWCEAQERWPNAVASKVALLVNTTESVRLAVDSSTVESWPGSFPVTLSSNP